jgi:hypothetical protein
MIPVPRTPEEFFDGSETGLAVFTAIASAIADFDGVAMRISKSQIAFRTRRGFAYVWRPSRYLKTNVPVVLSIALPVRVDSPRFKSIVNPARHTWMHHLELREPADVDHEVAEWLRMAYRSRSPVPDLFDTSESFGPAAVGDRPAQ